MTGIGEGAGGVSEGKQPTDKVKLKMFTPFQQCISFMHFFNVPPLCECDLLLRVRILLYLETVVDYSFTDS